MAVLNKYKHWGLKILPLDDKYLDFVLSKDDTPSSPIASLQPPLGFHKAPLSPKKKGPPKQFDPRAE